MENMKFGTVEEHSRRLLVFFCRNINNFWQKRALYRTSVISYIILKRTIEYYKSENISRIRESYKERLRSDVASRLAGLNTKRFMLLYIRLAQGEPSAPICQILDETSIEIENNLSSFKILYISIVHTFLLLIFHSMNVLQFL